MPQIIEIDGGLVSLVNREVMNTIPLSEWLPKIEKRVPVSTPVLPTNARAIWWDTTDITRKKLLVLIEREPQIINLNMTGDIHRISIPWTRFFFYASTRDSSPTASWSLEDYRIYWSNKKYSNPTEADMITALLPNVYDDARICFGSTGADAYQPLADRLDQIINEFYVSTFNHDLTIHRPNGWRGWRAWERMTETNPMGWLTWPDWDQRPKVSWESLCARWQQDPSQRFAYMASADPIPEVPLGATFGRINEWLTEMDPTLRRRLMIAISSAELPEPAVADGGATDDETDDEDEDA